MQLNQYPKAIAEAQSQVIRLQQQVRSLKEAIAREEAAIDQEVAFNADLKNDAQRKAKRAELTAQSVLWADLHDALTQDEGQLRDEEIKLGLLLNTFSVLKLERREAIAQLELQARAAA
jgi:hypothetical protein